MEVFHLFQKGSCTYSDKAECMFLINHFTTSINSKMWFLAQVNLCFNEQTVATYQLSLTASMSLTRFCAKQMPKIYNTKQKYFTLGHLKADRDQIINK